MKITSMEVMRKVEVLVPKVAAQLVLKRRMDIVIPVMLDPFRLKEAHAKSAFQELFLCPEAAIVQLALQDRFPHCQVLPCAVHVLSVSMKRATSFATSAPLVSLLKPTPPTPAPNAALHARIVQQILSQVKRPAQDAVHVLLVRFQPQAVQPVASVMPVFMLQVAHACNAQQANSQQLPV